MTSHAKRTRVLIVDDSAMDRRLAGGLLEKREGVTLDFAVDGRAALAAIEAHLPDIVVTDLHMPEMDGLALVDAIRQRRRNLPVVLMTAHGSEETAVRALRHGAASYVPKRNLANDLFETIESVLAISRADRDHQRVLDSITESETSFSIDNDTQPLPAIIGHIEFQLRGMGLCDETEALQVGVALREALVNAIYHGNLEVSSSLLDQSPEAFFEKIEERKTQSPFKDRRVTLAVRHDRAEARYEVTDEGPGFDPASLPDPTDIGNLDKPHGRGLLLIRTFMDSVAHNERGNRLTMVKRAARLRS